MQGFGGRKSLTSIGNQLCNAKITVWNGIHANGVLDPYYFDGETVRGADYYLLLNIYVKSSRYSFTLNYLFQQDGSPTYM